MVGVAVMRPKELNIFRWHGFCKSRQDEALMRFLSCQCGAYRPFQGEVTYPIGDT